MNIIKFGYAPMCLSTLLMSMPIFAEEMLPDQHVQHAMSTSSSMSMQEIHDQSHLNSSMPMMPSAEHAHEQKSEHEHHPSDSQSVPTQRDESHHQHQQPNNQISSEKSETNHSQQHSKHHSKHESSQPPSDQSQQESPSLEDQPHAQAHLKEHGGQIFQASNLETKWMNSDAGQGTFKTQFESRIGTDEHKIFVQVHADKAESASTSTDAMLLYSRNIANYWDVQVGGRYRHAPDHFNDQDRFDGIVGLQGLAPYFFETELYAFIGADDQYSISLEAEKDLLLTQKLILKPYINALAVISDHSKYAQKAGLNAWTVGLETRYEINKKLMPFIDLAYGYEKGDEQTQWQERSSSEYDSYYGAGIRFRF